MNVWQYSEFRKTVWKNDWEREKKKKKDLENIMLVMMTSIYKNAILLVKNFNQIYLSWKKGIRENFLQSINESIIS